MELWSPCNVHLWALWQECSPGCQEKKRRCYGIAWHMLMLMLMPHCHLMQSHCSMMSILESGLWGWALKSSPMPPALICIPSATCRWSPTRFARSLRVGMFVWLICMTSHASSQTAARSRFDSEGHGTDVRPLPLSRLEMELWKTCVILTKLAISRNEARGGSCDVRIEMQDASRSFGQHRWYTCQRQVSDKKRFL